MKDMEKTPVSVVLVGISGMGQSYLETLLEGFPPGDIEIQAVVEPYPEISPYRDELQDREIPILTSLAPVYEDQRPPDLVVVCSPIHYHVSQTSYALEQGSHVLCEKPIGGTIQDAERMIETMNRT
jgi:predicted dehydrogenase